MDKPLVSINCPTYNHAKYLPQCLDGFLMQETDFEFEIILCDDCSPDNTRNVVEKYIRDHRFGYRIKYYCQKENVGMMRNGTYSLRQCSGKYIALCEGDDFWTDPLKLKKQVGFLETNTDYSISFHPVDIYDNSRHIIINGLKKDKISYNIDDLSTSNFIDTCSVVLKRDLLTTCLDHFTELPVGDYPILIFLSLHGKINCINEIMGCYRIHSNGIWTKKSKLDKLRDLIEVSDFFINYLIKNPHKSLALTNFTKMQVNYIKEAVDISLNTQDRDFINLLYSKFTDPYWSSIITDFVFQSYGKNELRYERLLNSKKLRVINFFLKPFRK